MANPASLKLACVSVMMCVVVFAPLASAAISCGSVVGQLGGCIAYLRGVAGRPSVACCGGIRSLQRMASTQETRRVACKCLTTASRAMKGLNYGNAASLPRLCGVSIPYAISPRTNCNAIH